MLLAFVLAAWLAPAALEWVEISQTLYKRPARAHDHPDNPGDRHTFYPAHEETTSGDLRTNSQHKTTFVEDDELVQLIPDTTTYLNGSITEHNWNRNKFGANIKRFDGNAKMKPNITPEFSLEIFGEVTEEPELVTRLRDKEVFAATIERVPNKGSVKRVQLSDTPVKSPSIQNAVSPIRRNDVRQYGATDSGVSDEFEMKADIVKDAQSESITPTSHIKRIFSSIMAAPVWKHDRIDTSTVWPITGPTITVQKYSQSYHPEFNKTPNNDSRKKASISKIGNSTADDNRVPIAEMKANDLRARPLNKIEGNENRIKEFPNLVTKNKKPEQIDLKEAATSADVGENMRAHEYHKAEPNIDKNIKGSENIIKDSMKVNTMENVMKFLKVVADTISKNTRSGVNGKVKYLQELKDTLLNSIEARIEATWPDDSTRESRRARSAEARGHVEFPSSESSLMTISFLTFAVFLIKLVLQVIQTYKHKTMMVAPLVVATAGRQIRKQRNYH